MPKSQSLNKLNPQQINIVKQDYPSLETFSKAIRTRGCSGCELGSQKGLCGPVTFRGNVNSKILILAEAPGKREDKEGKPLVGPAGIKGDQIFASIGIDTNRDCLVSNVVLCRPIAPWGCPRENNPPKTNEIESCKPWINYIIELTKPKLIILEGRVAVSALLSKDLSSQTLAELVGNFYKNDLYQDIDFFVLYHPSAILRQKEGSNMSLYYRKKTWEAVNKLKGYLKENNVI